MIKNNSFFLDNLKLMKDMVYEDFYDNDKFMHIKGILNDEYYNFIVPFVTSENLDFNITSQLISKEKDEGYKLSYYIEENLNENYKPKIKSLNLEEISDDTYVYLEQDELFNLEEHHTVEEVNEKNLEDFIKLATICFPEWENNRAYGERVYNLSKSSNSDKIYKNFLLKFENTYVAFGCIVYSIGLNLAYTHNLGTHPDFRHKGYFTYLKKILINDAISNGVHRFYAIVEDQGGSFNTSIKLGYKKILKFFLYN